MSTHFPRKIGTSNQLGIKLFIEHIPTAYKVINVAFIPKNWLITKVKMPKLITSISLFSLSNYKQ